jgi:hypothetical protein
MNDPQPKLEVLQASPADTKQEIIRIFRLALSVINDYPDDPRLLDDINLIIQGKLNSSPLYSQHPELEEINDELLGYEDLELVLKDKEKVQAAISDWQSYVGTVPAKLDSIMPESSA